MQRVNNTPMLTMHAQVGSPLIALEEDSPWLNHCITGVEADFSQMACNAIASLSPLLASACERDTPMSPPPPALPGDTSDIEDTDEDTVQAPVRLLSFKIAPCISLDTITVEFPSFDVYLACLAENIAAFIEELFRMAADAVRGMVDSLTAMFSNAVQWAIDKIEELWNGVRSVIDGIGPAAAARHGEQGSRRARNRAEPRYPSASSDGGGDGRAACRALKTAHGRRGTYCGGRGHEWRHMC